MAMSPINSDDLASEHVVLPLLVPTAAYKPLGFKNLIFCVRFVIALRRTTAPPPANHPSTSRTSSSRSYTAIDVDAEGEGDEIRAIEKRRLKRIVREKDSEALEEFGGVQAAVLFLRSEPQPQITGNEGLKLFVRGLGSCFLFSREFWFSSWLSLSSCTIFPLIIAAGLSFAIGSLEQGIKYGWHDAVGILVAVFVLVFFPPAISFHRKRAEEKGLLKIQNKLEVRVKRGGICDVVSVSDVKEGEIIHLKKGDRVPADGLLIRGENLILDEVINRKVDPEGNPFLFSGSVVEYGEGDMVAVSTVAGADTALGKGLLAATIHPSPETLLQSRINKPYQFIEKLALGVSLMILFVVLTRLVCKKHDAYYNDKPETKGEVTMGLMETVFKRMYSFLKSRQGVSFLATVLLTMVIGIQHGMPLAITISLSLCREKIILFGGKSLNLLAFVTSALVSTICIDITGELSLHEVEIELFIGVGKINPGVVFHADIHEGFEQAAKVLCFDPKTSVPLRNHLLNFWENLGLKINVESLDQKFGIIDQKFLSSEKGIGVLMRKSTGNTEANLFHVLYYGDASTILNMCSQYYEIGGIVHDIRNQKDSFREVIDDMKEKGARSIAFACKQTNDRVFEGELKLLGFVGYKYSCEKIKRALKDLKDLGIKIVLISEDDLSIATSVATGLGIQCGSHNNQVVEGKRFRETMKNPGTEKKELMESITVMGKATPEDKHLLQRELKAVGHVVAFVGGLTTSDAPTLREADVGVTQENRSTKASRMVSNLTFEAPTSLDPILRYGRCVYLNIQKFYQINLIASISGLLITLVCTMVSGNSPITTIHLIWVTVIVCLLGSPMMVMELNGEEVKIPLEGDRDQSLITKVMRKKIVIHVLCQALLFVLSEYVGQKIPLPSMNEAVRHTMIFNTYILWQICNLLGAMGLATEGIVVLKAVLKSLWFLISLVGVLVVQVTMIEFAGEIVNAVKLSAVQWAICFLFASLILTLEWARRISLQVLATLFSSAQTSFMFVFSRP